MSIMNYSVLCMPCKYSFIWFKLLFNVKWIICGFVTCSWVTWASISVWIWQAKHVNLDNLCRFHIVFPYLVLNVLSPSFCCVKIQIRINFFGLITLGTTSHLTQLDLITICAQLAGLIYSNPWHRCSVWISDHQMWLQIFSLPFSFLFLHFHHSYFHWSLCFGSFSSQEVNLHRGD